MSVLVCIIFFSLSLSLYTYTYIYIYMYHEIEISCTLIEIGVKLTSKPDGPTPHGRRRAQDLGNVLGH